MKCRTSLFQWAMVAGVLLSGCAGSQAGRGRDEAVLRPPAEAELPAGSVPLGLYIDKPSELRTIYWRYDDGNYRINAGEDFLTLVTRELRRHGFMVIVLEKDPESAPYSAPMAGALALKIVPAKTENSPATLIFQAEVKVFNADRRKLAEMDLRSRVSRNADRDRRKVLESIWQESFREIQGRFVSNWDEFIAADSAQKGKLATAWSLPLDVRFRPGDPNQLENAAVMESLNPLILKLREHKNISLSIELHSFPEPVAAGSPAVNPESLAVGRGGALRRYVSEWGIGADRITVKVRDQEVPLVPKDQKGAARINNRIDFVLTR